MVSLCVPNSCHVLCDDSKKPGVKPVSDRLYAHLSPVPQARAMASGMPAQQRTRKLGYMLGQGQGTNSTTPRGRHSSPLSGNR